MDDLAALLRFLKVEPFANSSAVTAYQALVTDHNRTSSQHLSECIRHLLQQICLRRLAKTHLHFEASYERRSLEFTEGESAEYNAMLKNMKRDMDLHISDSPDIKQYSKLFSLIMQLRRFCNHGPRSNNESCASSQWETPSFTSVPSSPGSEGEACDTCQSTELLDLVQDCSFCPSCFRALQPATGEEQSSIGASQRPKRPLTDGPVSTSRPLKVPRSQVHQQSSNMELDQD